MKTAEEKKKVVAMLTKCRRDITDEFEKSECTAMIKVLEGDSHELYKGSLEYKAASRAAKWLKGRISDAALFV